MNVSNLTVIFVDICDILTSCTERHRSFGCAWVIILQHTYSKSTYLDTFGIICSVEQPS